MAAHRTGAEWIDKFGDVDGDGFVEYAQRSSKGLVQQGWKDSNDSVFHEDGTLAEPQLLCVKCRVTYMRPNWLRPA